MEIQHTQGILFKFRRPCRMRKRQPSEAMRKALQCLAESDEMRPFVNAARAQVRTVVVEVFHSCEGHPLLIHVAAAPRHDAHGVADA